MKIQVLAESNFDGVFLSRILEEEIREEIVEVGYVEGLGMGYSTARTILAAERRPVVVVVDADSADERVAREKIIRVEELLGAASKSTPHRAIVVVPELEILFFQCPRLIFQVFGPIDEHVREIAELSPRRALEKLNPEGTFNQTRIRLLKSLSDEDVTLIRTTEPIQELLSFLVEASVYARRNAALSS